MTKRDNLVLTGVKVITWLIFISLSIQAGVLLFNYPSLLFSYNLKAAVTGPQKHKGWIFPSMFSLAVFITCLKAYLFYLVIRLMQTLDVSSPFHLPVARQISKISTATFSIGLISYIAFLSARNLGHHGLIMSNLSSFWGDSQAYILMSAIIYIIALIFKRGIEMQTENDLTI